MGVSRDRRKDGRRAERAQIAEKFPGVRVVRIEGARHHLANETPEYRQRVDDALASFVRTDGAP